MDREIGLRCDCGSETRVKDSRDAERSIRRRRACLICGARFTTYENRPGENIHLTAIEAAAVTRTVSAIMQTIKELNAEIEKLSAILR